MEVASEGSVVVVSAVDGDVEDNEVVELDGERTCGGCRCSKDGVVCSERCWERMAFAIRSSLKGLGRPTSSEDGDMGVQYSSTVPRIAKVISSRDVYGKQTFRTHLVLCAVVAMARSTASRTSGLMSSLCPRIWIRAPYRSRMSPCWTSCCSLTLAISISPSTSYLERLKFSMLKA